MSLNKTSVSLHPYFTIRDGKMEDFKAIIQKFIAKTTPEENCISYNFTINEAQGIALCRESYTDAEATLAHVTSVGEIIAEALTVSDLTRFEVHGPANELEKLKEPFAELNPEYYVLEDGVEK